MTWHIDMREVGMNIKEAKMQNYKIKVANEAENKEVQELFLGLGYEFRWGKELADTCYEYIATEGKIIMCGSSEGGFEKYDALEITLPQLRDLVVLHRNDVSDATHKSDILEHKFFVSSGGKAYQYLDGKWQPKICHSYLVPIGHQEEPQMTWQDVLRAVLEGKEVEIFRDGKWQSINEKFKDEGYRLAPQRKTLNGNYTKEELLKIAGEMG